jgi:hypothetical protein
MIHIEENMLGKSMCYHNQNLFKTYFPICLWDQIYLSWYFIWFFIKSFDYAFSNFKSVILTRALQLQINK